MAQCKDIDPTGGGDFTTQAAAWIWAQSQPKDHYTFWLHGGGDLGGLYMYPADLPWATDEDDCFLWAAAAGQSPYHVESGWFQTGFRTEVDYTQVRGLRISGSGGVYFVAIDLGGACCIVDRCWLEAGTGNLSTASLVYGANAGVVNSVVVGAPNTTALSGNNGGIFFDHCTIVRCKNGVREGQSGAVTARNCVVCAGPGGFPGTDFGAGVVTVTCASGDDSGDITDIDTDAFVDFDGGDYRPAAGGALHNAGTEIAGIETDILGNPRVSGGTPDIGAIELQETVVAAARAAMMMGGAF